MQRRQRNWRIAPPIIVTAIAAAKIAANSRSSTAKARAQPKEASIESANNSRRPGSVHGAFISQVGCAFCKDNHRPMARRGAILDGPWANPIPLSPDNDDEKSLKTRMRAFNGDVAIVIARMLCSRHVAACPSGFVAPCLPIRTDKLPSGSEWLHEIKHDGFRIIARKNRAQVKLYSRPGNDLTYRFPLIVETLASLRSRSCIIDGEAVACDDNDVTSFNRLRYRYHDESVFLYAFDLIELNGDDLRRDPLEGRKTTLEMILAKAGAGICFNEHMDGDGETVFRHACKLGLEGIVSKRKDSRYRSGRSPYWLKMKNADAPAVKREAEEDWTR
jgi:bifunctional non-homologous end joining protein LigD